ncbi:MAG TPA: hypothetical protein RMH99_30965 [Sandaracinaceae bacterium LLY-WYZ-13_1]|nr:hypothetical protein [Sandaracinaceae bacterium LLY-WYZ-13_1]
MPTRPMPHPTRFALGLALASLFLVVACAQGGADPDGGPSPGNDSSTPGTDAQMPGTDGGGGGCPMTCPSGTVCRGTVCVAACSPDGACEGGRTCCEDACVNTDNSVTDCGECNNDCGLTGNVCAMGMCRCGAGDPCAPPQICCGGGCVDVLTDPANCGECGMRCGTGEECVDGVCVPPACDPACADGETCMEGTCMCGAGPSCTEGRACCDGTCVDTSSNGSHCGICGNACTGGLTCIGGTCTADVPCEPACGPGESCVAGSCQCGAGAPCGASQRCCDGLCADIQTDVGNCGACGRVCSGSEQCCSGLCVNTNTNPDHCGGCGRACNEDAADGCTDGRCTCDGGDECSPAGTCMCLPPPFSGCNGICF